MKIQTLFDNYIFMKNRNLIFPTLNSKRKENYMLNIHNQFWKYKTIVESG